MKSIKIAAFFLAAVISFSVLAACNDTTYIMSVNGEKYPANAYAFYAYWMRDNYETQMYMQYGTELAASLNQPVDESGTLLHQFITSQVKDQYISYILINKKFDELGLTLPEETLAEIDEYYQTTYIEQYGEEKINKIITTLGLTKEEFKEILSISYKNNALIEHYFGEGGTMEVYESELQSKFEESYARFKYIVFYKVDSSGSELTIDELNEKNTKAKEVIAKLDSKEATLEELIPLYSEDYVVVAEDATEETKASAELQNKEIIENGIITDNNGIFNETVYQYYGYTVDSKIVNNLFSMNVGDYQLFEISNSLWIVQKCDVNEKSEFYDARRDSVFSALTSADIGTLYSTWLNDLPYIFNESAVSKYDPRALEPLFIDVDAMKQALASGGQ